jgi:hypothetical protein
MAPTPRQSLHGTPISQANGAFSQPSATCIGFG